MYCINPGARSARKRDLDEERGIRNAIVIEVDQPIIEEIEYFDRVAANVVVNRTGHNRLAVGTDKINIEIASRTRSP